MPRKTSAEIDRALTRIETKLRKIDDMMKFLTWLRRAAGRTRETLATKRAWVAGFGLALAEVNRKWDMPTNIEEVIREAGLELPDFKAAGLDPYDWRELARCIPKGPKRR